MRDWIQEKYLDSRHVAQLARQYRAARPFAHIALHDLLRPQRYRQLKAALRKQHFARKEADLFSFMQTQDLYDAKDKTLNEFLRLLQSREFTALINTIAGVKTTAGKVDASGFIYTPGDHLLCHDDGISSRRIAYILNLSSLAHGGALALLGSRRNRPTRVEKRIMPRENTLVLFTVTRKSHHQVEEVLQGSRMTITGWFHA